MSARPRVLIGLTALILMLEEGCLRFPGQPGASADATGNDAPDFARLYAQNCAGCHGANGAGGPALALSNPVYLAIAPDAGIRRAIALGVDGTMMPAFSTGYGGMLTDAEVDAIARGLREKWGRSQPGAAPGAPPYSARLAGDAKRGARSFTASCAGCHGENGEGGRKAASVVDDSFLALVSDQGLRTTILAGRPDLGQPDWRGDGAVEPLSDQELTDIVAWMASRRATAPGRPYPAPKE
jgi:mono/diheme cytochrome c family protein